MRHVQTTLRLVAMAISVSMFINLHHTNAQATEVSLTDLQRQINGCIVETVVKASKLEGDTLDAYVLSQLSVENVAARAYGIRAWSGTNKKTK